MALWKLSGCQTLLLVKVCSIITLGAVSFKILLAFYSESHTRKVMRIIDKISALKNPSVRMKNPHLLEEKLCQIVRDGKSKLTVIADFDYTMSRFRKDDIVCQTCHGALSNCFLVSKPVQEQFRLLYELYHPIELDHSITTEEKEYFMKEWFDKSGELIINSNLNKQDIKRLISESQVCLRDGCDVMLKLLKNHEIPIVVISAGLGDLIVEVLRQQSTLDDNIKVVANFMDFNSDGTLVTFKNETIHCCNKNKTPLNHPESFTQISDRKNAILLGDLVEDAAMIDAIPQLENVIKIGYLNYKYDEFLPKYMDAFDIVLVNDQTFDITNGILQLINLT